MKIILILFCSALFCLSCSLYKIDNNESKYLLEDETNTKYYLIEVIRKAQNKNKLGKTPMIIINGEPVFYYYKDNVEHIKIQKSQIRRLEIIESSDCVKTFGSACKYGLIRIGTY